MNKPDAQLHNPDPVYLRLVIHTSNMTQEYAAHEIGISERTLGKYLSLELKAPYPVQFCLEALPTGRPNAQMHNTDPAYLRLVIEATQITKEQAARQIGIAAETLDKYLIGDLAVTYPVQFCLESLVGITVAEKVESLFEV